MEERKQPVKEEEFKAPIKEEENKDFEKSPKGESENPESKEMESEESDQVMEEALDFTKIYANDLKFSPDRSKFSAKLVVMFHTLLGRIKTTVISKTMNVSKAQKFVESEAGLIYSTVDRKWHFPTKQLQSKTSFANGALIPDIKYRDDA